jgi:hypothetical protein
MIVNTMVEQVTFQTLFQFLQTIGILVGVFYYIMTLRNQKINRQAQLFMNIYGLMVTPEMQGRFRDVQRIEVNSMDDWSRLQEDRAQFETWGFYCTYYEGIGVLVKEGLINIELVAKMLSGNVIWFWEKYRVGILDIRRGINWPRFGIEIEYLYKRILDYGERNPKLEIHSPTL